MRHSSRQTVRERGPGGEGQPRLKRHRKNLPPKATSLARLQANPHLALRPDTTVQTAYDEHAWWETDTSGYKLYPAAAVNVHYLHEYSKAWSPNIECNDGRITFENHWRNWSLKPHRGAGVTVAVIDSGLMPMASSSDWTPDNDGTLYAENSGRCLIYRDFIDSAGPTNSVDSNGHGTHIAATIADNREDTLQLMTGAILLYLLLGHHRRQSRRYIATLAERHPGRRGSRRQPARCPCPRCRRFRQLCRRIATATPFIIIRHAPPHPGVYYCRLVFARDGRH